METLAGARLDAVFDDCDESLLILDAAGAGKTVMLAELARELLDRAERDMSLPIPAPPHLSTWTGDEDKANPKG
jgi:hypothetical protein